MYAAVFDFGRRRVHDRHLHSRQRRSGRVHAACSGRGVTRRGSPNACSATRRHRRLRRRHVRSSIGGAAAGTVEPARARVGRPRRCPCPAQLERRKGEEGPCTAIHDGPTASDDLRPPAAHEFDVLVGGDQAVDGDGQEVIELGARGVVCSHDAADQRLEPCLPRPISTIGALSASPLARAQAGPIAVYPDGGAIPST